MTPRECPRFQRAITGVMLVTCQACHLSCVTPVICRWITLPASSHSIAGASAPPQTRRRRGVTAIENPVRMGQETDAPGGSAAARGAYDHPVRRDGPGTGPARRRHRPGQRRPGLRRAQEEGRVHRPPRLRPADSRPSSTPSATPTPASGYRPCTGSSEGSSD